MAQALPERPAPLERSTVVALAAMAMAVFVIANDVTALSVALPAIEQDFDADVGTVQWVISAYALIFGVLIVTGGRLADLLGRRRIFFAGAAVFAAFSLLGAVAPSAVWLIVARGLMGIGGAMMWPAILGMTYAILFASTPGLAGILARPDATRQDWERQRACGEKFLKRYGQARSASVAAFVLGAILATLSILL